MATIHVIKPFTLTLSADERKHYVAGTHRDVPDDHAAHWFTKLHIGEPEDVPAQPVSPAEFAVLRREAKAAHADLAAERERVAALEAELASTKSDLAAARAEVEELTAPTPAGGGDQAKTTGNRERPRS